MYELQSILLKILGKILSGCEYIIFNGVFLDIYFEIPSYILVTGNILVITDSLCSAISMNPRITVTVLCQLPSVIQIMSVWLVFDLINNFFELKVYGYQQLNFIKCK